MPNTGQFYLIEVRWREIPGSAAVTYQTFRDSPTGKRYQPLAGPSRGNGLQAQSKAQPFTRGSAPPELERPPAPETQLQSGDGRQEMEPEDQGA